MTAESLPDAATDLDDEILLDQEPPAPTQKYDFSGDLRGALPKLGLRNYWYPVILERRVGRKRPVRVSMIGEDLCLFRKEDGEVVALSDVCPHRGARLSEGDCHWAGTVACPYHGWVFNAEGKNLAVLGEGPDSNVAGKAGTSANVYPVQTLKGVVFAWIGDEAPAPIEEDVPEEFFDPDAVIYANDLIHWKTNWEVAIENSMDAHVNYLHRDHLQTMLASPTFMPRGAAGARVAFTGNGFTSAVPPKPQPEQDEHTAAGIQWPKRSIRKRWAWIFRPFFASTHVPAPMPQSDWWGTGHRLPGMFRAGIAQTRDPDGRPIRPRTGGLFGFYTRWPVAVGDWFTRVWYFQSTKPTSTFERAKNWLLYWMLYRWLVQYNFSQQDMSVMENIDFEAPERLSGTDSEIVFWRRLVVTKHRGGRNAEYTHHGKTVDIKKPQLHA